MSSMDLLDFSVFYVKENENYYGDLCSLNLFESSVKQLFNKHTGLSANNVYVEYETYPYGSSSNGRTYKFRGTFERYLDEREETLEEFLEDVE